MTKFCLAMMFSAAVAAPLLGQNTDQSAGQKPGEDTFKARCAMCHGEKGLADSPISKSLNVPSVKSPGFAKLSAAEMAAIVKNGKEKMPAFGSQLSEAQIREVVGYLRSLAKK